MSEKSDKRSRQSLIARIIAYELFKLPKICEECGGINRIEVHHIDGNRDNNQRENLKTLCKRHHNNLHGILPPIKERTITVDIAEQLPKTDCRYKINSKTYLNKQMRWRKTLEYRERWGIK